MKIETNQIRKDIMIYMKNENKNSLYQKLSLAKSNYRYFEISIDLKNDNNSSLSCTKHNLARLYPYVILMNGFYANQIET